MINPSEIPGKILNGERMDIIISAADPERHVDAEILELTSFLRQFRQKCGGSQCIFFSESVSRDGKKKLEINVGPVPYGPRELLAGTLEQLIKAENSLLKIELKEKKS